MDILRTLASWYFLTIWVRSISCSACFRTFNSAMSPSFTLIIEEYHNEAYHAFEKYLLSKLKPLVCKLKRDPGSSNVELQLANNECFVEFEEGMRVHWELSKADDKKVVQIKFYPDKSVARKAYLQQVLVKFRELTLFYSNADYSGWKATPFSHPSTFQTLAMTITPQVIGFAKKFLDEMTSSSTKTLLISGASAKAKANLIAATANHMRYDVYVLQVPPNFKETTINKLLFLVRNRSILVIEDGPNCFEISPCLERFNFCFGVERLVVFTSNSMVSIPCPSFAEKSFHIDERLLTRNQKKKLKKKLKRLQ